jgi:hypothetical protein
MTEGPEAQNIEGAEQVAKAHLLLELSKPLDLIARAFNLIPEIAAALPNPIPDERGGSIRVGVLLLHRLANDLRGTVLTATSGYPAQALTLVASMYEVAHTIAYIGNDEALAIEWQNHLDPTRSFRPVTALTLEGIKRIGFSNPEAQADRHYCRYTQLCWAKHAWPQHEMTLSITTHLGQQVTVYGPNTSSEALRASWFALENAVWCTYQGIRSVVQFQLEGRGTPAIEKQNREIAYGYKAVREAYAKRWKDIDPFPGKWKTFSKAK